LLMKMGRIESFPIATCNVLLLDSPEINAGSNLYCLDWTRRVLLAWSGPEGSRKLRFPNFMTTAQDGGKVVSLTHRPPLPQELHLVLISVRG
jgi:hypothetical protein